MKKNYFKFLSVLVMVCCFSFAFSSCSDDDDEKSTNSLIVGKWRLLSASQGVDEDEAKWIFNIKSDGTSTNGDGDEYDDKGTWTLDDDIFKFTSRIGLSYQAEITTITNTYFECTFVTPSEGGVSHNRYERIN